MHLPGLCKRRVTKMAVFPHFLAFLPPKSTFGGHFGPYLGLKNGCLALWEGTAVGPIRLRMEGEKGGFRRRNALRFERLIAAFRWAKVERVANSFSAGEFNLGRLRTDEWDLSARSLFSGQCVGLCVAGSGAKHLSIERVTDENVKMGQIGRGSALLRQLEQGSEWCDSLAACRWDRFSCG